MQANPYILSTRRLRRQKGMHWSDEGIVLGVRKHGEAGVILELLTAAHGRHLRPRSRRRARNGCRRCCAWQRRAGHVACAARRASRRLSDRGHRPAGGAVLRLAAGALRACDAHEPVAVPARARPASGAFRDGSRSRRPSRRCGHRAGALRARSNSRSSPSSATASISGSVRRQARWTAWSSCRRKADGLSAQPRESPTRSASSSCRAS